MITFFRQKKKRSRIGKCLSEKLYLSRFFDDRFKDLFYSEIVNTGVKGKNQQRQKK